MDDDDYRRGRLTNHKVFGEAMAILAGDALLTLAFRLVADNAARMSDPRMIARVVADVADAAGTDGMVGGQVIDIESEGKDVGPDTLEYIHRHKTAALIRVSPTAGATPAGGRAGEVGHLRGDRRVPRLAHPRAGGVPDEWRRLPARAETDGAVEQ